MTELRLILLVAKRRHHLLIEDLPAIAPRGAEASGHPPRLHAQPMLAGLQQNPPGQIGIMSDPLLARTNPFWQPCVRIR